MLIITVSTDLISVLTESPHSSVWASACGLGVWVCVYVRTQIHGFIHSGIFISVNIALGKLTRVKKPKEEEGNRKRIPQGRRWFHSLKRIFAILTLSALGRGWTVCLDREIACSGLPPVEGMQDPHSCGRCGAEVSDDWREILWDVARAAACLEARPSSAGFRSHSQPCWAPSSQLDLRSADYLPPGEALIASCPRDMDGVLPWGTPMSSFSKGPNVGIYLLSQQNLDSNNPR